MLYMYIFAASQASIIIQLPISNHQSIDDLDSAKSWPSDGASGARKLNWRRSSRDLSNSSHLYDGAGSDAQAYL